MIKIIKEEINLCKQVGKGIQQRVGREIGLFMKTPKVRQVGQGQLSINQDTSLNMAMAKISPSGLYPTAWSFLREKGYRVSTDEDFVGDEPFEVRCYGHKSKVAFRKYGKTPLEACLKAVLAVLEEK